MPSKKWEVLGILQDSKTPKVQVGDIVSVLLTNRGITTKKEKEEFFNPTPPEKISVKSLSLSTREVNCAINRIKRAKEKKEKVIVFGDYDADGVCATATLWECLFELGLDVLPYIPDRFSEGYGLKEESVKTLRKKYKNLGLIITVDNGIVANQAVDAANKLGIDVIITDHHQKGKKLPKAYAIIHTTEIGGAGIAWVFAREITKKLKNLRSEELKNKLELAAIGTIADQLPLTGANRSFAKHGLQSLRKTKRLGLLALFKEARIQRGSAGWRIKTYDINFIVAPRINAMGRLKHAMDSLRLLCVKNRDGAQKLAYKLGRTNIERQKIVNDVVAHAQGLAEEGKWEGVMLLHHESYHEGVIGLAASKLVDRFYRPVIVVYRGEKYSKASARSIPGFNIIEAIRNFDDMLLDGGGHPMAAGFTIETKKLENFVKRLEKATKPLLTEDILKKKLKVDLELNFGQLNYKLEEKIREFEPNGIGNPTPIFSSTGVNVLNARTVGVKGRHLKLTLEQQDKVFDAIAFGFGDFFRGLSPDSPIDVAYNLEENVWNGRTNLQLKVKDIKLSNYDKK